jgi:hypothetical protein
MSKKFLTPIGLATLASDPETGSEGDMYYNTTSDIPRVYKNNAWEDLAGGISIYDQPEQPTNINVGDLWLDTDAEILTQPSFNINDTVTAIEGFFNLPTNAVDTSPRRFNNSATFQNQTMYFTFFTPLRTLTVSSISMASAGSSTTNANTVRFGLYTFDGNTAIMVARTANDPTIFSLPQTLYQRFFSTEGEYPSNYTLVKGNRYAVAVIVDAQFTGNAYVNDASVPNVLNTLDPRMHGLHAGHNDLQYSNSTFSTTPIAYWARLS